MHDDRTHEAHDHIELVTGDYVPEVPAHKPDDSECSIADDLKPLKDRPVNRRGLFVIADADLSAHKPEPPKHSSDIDM